MRTHHRFLVPSSLLLLGLGVFGLDACSTAHPGAGSGGSGGNLSGSEIPGTVSVSPGAGAGSATPHADGGGTDAGGGADASTLGPPIDASLRGPTHTDDLCSVSPIAWWTTTALVDDAVGSASLAAALNALFALPNAHPFTIAAFIGEGAGDGWRFKATASLANGIGQQYFPFDHAATAVAASRTSTSVGAADREASAWLHIVDRASQDVWLPLANVDAHATITDSYCAQLTDGVLTATVAHSAGAISMTLVDGSVTNLAGLLGAEEPSGGWPLRMTFAAEKVQITLK